jgi:hypothetical protein
MIKKLKYNHAYLIQNVDFAEDNFEKISKLFDVSEISNKTIEEISYFILESKNKNKSFVNLKFH